MSQPSEVPSPVERLSGIPPHAFNPVLSDAERVIELLTCIQWTGPGLTTPEQFEYRVRLLEVIYETSDLDVLTNDLIKRGLGGYVSLGHRQTLELLKDHRNELSEKLVERILRLNIEEPQPV